MGPGGRFCYLQGVTDSAEQRRERARERRERAILRKARLRPVEDEVVAVEGAEAISLVTRLTLESWTVAGLEVPIYPRSETPYRFVRSGER